jgi:hypothetical protein
VLSESGSFDAESLRDKKNYIVIRAVAAVHASKFQVICVATVPAGSLLIRGLCEFFACLGFTECAIFDCGLTLGSGIQGYLEVSLEVMPKGQQSMHCWCAKRHFLTF